jgi:uncharacterized membrane protein YebE (DUF533 family)
LAKQGQQMAEKGLGVPESGPERDQALGNLGKGAALGGVLALLLGTHVGRRVAGPLVKMGGLAAIGAVGYMAYKQWQAKQQGATEAGTPISELNPAAASARSHVLLQAMIAAANADGHIDAQERLSIQSRLADFNLTPEQHAWFEREINAPQSVDDLAALSDSISTASEIYVTSLLVVETANAAERDYLNRLAAALKLPSGLVEQLEQQANQ